jgi:hypothetical protein
MPARPLSVSDTIKDFRLPELSEKDPHNIPPIIMPMKRDEFNQAFLDGVSSKSHWAVVGSRYESAMICVYVVVDGGWW